MFRQSLVKQIRPVGSKRFLTTSSILSNENKGKSPLEVFFQTFKQEVKKSSELKENIKIAG